MLFRSNKNNNNNILIYDECLFNSTNKLIEQNSNFLIENENFEFISKIKNQFKQNAIKINQILIKNDENLIENINQILNVILSLFF